MGKVVNIYLATSIRAPSRQPGCYLYILETQTAKGPATITKKELLEESTENQSTLLALCEALGRLRMSCSLHLYLDCSYVAAALSQGWYREWEYHSWMNKKGRPVTDGEIWRQTSSLLRPHDFQVHLKEPHSYREWQQREVGIWQDTR